MGISSSQPPERDPEGALERPTPGAALETAARENGTKMAQRRAMGPFMV
jgi:hypothetical protein